MKFGILHDAPSTLFTFAVALRPEYIRLASQNIWPLPQVDMSISGRDRDLILHGVQTLVHWFADSIRELKAVY